VWVKAPLAGGVAGAKEWLFDKLRNEFFEREGG
jgi:hypothetical protein